MAKAKSLFYVLDHLFFIKNKASDMCKITLYQLIIDWKTQFVGSFDLTWWPDLAWPWAEIFTKVAEKMRGKVGENLAALRAAVFSPSSINLRGRSNAPLPSRAPVNTRMFVCVLLAGIFGYYYYCWLPSIRIQLYGQCSAGISVCSCICRSMLIFF